MKNSYINGFLYLILSTEDLNLQCENKRKLTSLVTSLCSSTFRLPSSSISLNKNKTKLIRIETEIRIRISVRIKINHCQLYRNVIEDYKMSKNILPKTLKNIVLNFILVSKEQNFPQIFWIRWKTCSRITWCNSISA